MGTVNSPRFRLNRVEIRKILIGLGIAAAGAALTYLEQTIPMIDFGQYTAIAVVLNSVFVNAVRKWLTIS